MENRFVQDRISILRTKKGVSEYKMSLDLGRSKGYIQSISSGKSLPSIPEFLNICDYLGVSPKEFFDEEILEPQLARELYTLASGLEEDDLKALICITKRLSEKKG